MAFPHHFLGGHAGHPGASMHMLAGPPGQMPPSPMSMHGHGGQLQLAGRGSMSTFGYPGQGAMVLGSPALSSGHPSPMSPFEMQQLQAGRQQGRLSGQGAFGGAAHGYGQGQLGFGNGMPASGMMPSTAMSPHMGGGGGFGQLDPMQMQQAQAMQQLHAMQQQHSPQSMMDQNEAFMSPQSQHAAAPGQYLGDMQRMSQPSQGGNPAAYVVGEQPHSMAGRLQGQGSGTASQQQSGNGDFDVEQEVTVKTKMRGRGTFSGNMTGSMQDSLDATHGLNVGGSSSRSSTYPQNQGMPGQHGMFAMGQAGHGMGQFSHGGQQMPMGRGSAPF